MTTPQPPTPAQDETAADGGTVAASPPDWSLLVQHMSVGWRCDHDFEGATCATCFANMEHAAHAAAALPTAAPAQGDRLSEAEVDDLYRRWLQKTSFTHLTTAVERILAARQRPEAPRWACPTCLADEATCSGCGIAVDFDGSAPVPTQRPEAVIAAEAWDEGEAASDEWHRQNDARKEWEPRVPEPVNPHRAARLAEPTPDGER